MAKEDRKKTAVITPFGLYIFDRMPFGLNNAGQDFQRLMDFIFGDIPYLLIYIDDTLIASETKEEHLQHLRTVFKILTSNSLVINSSKCVLGVTALNFLGYPIDATGVKPLEQRVSVIHDQKPPTTFHPTCRWSPLPPVQRPCRPQTAPQNTHMDTRLPKVIRLH